MRSAELYGAIVDESSTALVDLRVASWTPLNEERLAEICELLGRTIANAEVKKAVLRSIERAANVGLPPPILESCLTDPEVTPGLKCQQQWLPAGIESFRTELSQCWKAHLPVFLDRGRSDSANSFARPNGRAIRARGTFRGAAGQASVRGAQLPAGSRQEPGPRSSRRIADRHR